MVYYSVIIDPSYFPYLLFSDAPFIPCICITKNVFSQLLENLCIYKYQFCRVHVH